MNEQLNMFKNDLTGQTDSGTLLNERTNERTNGNSSNKDWIGKYHSVVGCLGAHNETKEAREEHDYYATQPIAAKLLIECEELNHNIWECACGEGHLSKVFIANGFNVKSTDLIDRGFGEGGVDFLKQTEIFDGDIVTNPPYRYAQEFIEHALTLLPEGNKLCMFLKIQFLEGKARRKLYDTTPPKTIYVSSSRIQCGRNGVLKGSMVAYAWYVWVKGFKGDPIIKWIN